MVSAGHPPPLLVRRGKAGYEDAMPTSSPGLPLGIAEGYPYESCQVTLQRAIACCCSPTRAGGARPANNQFGNKGIRGRGGRRPTGPARACSSTASSSRSGHASGRNPHDDVTWSGSAAAPDRRGCRRQSRDTPFAPGVRTRYTETRLTRSGGFGSPSRFLPADAGPG